MKEAIILRQDIKQDLTVEVTTTQTDLGYVTTISIQSEELKLVEEIKTSSLEMAIIEHDKAVTRLLKRDPTPEEEMIRPEVSSKNPYLHGATDFTPMLPGVVD